MLWASLVLWGFGGLWAAFHTFHHMTLTPDEGGGLAPEGQRIGWSITIALLAIALPLGMHIFSRCYVSRIVANRSRTLMYYETVGWIRPKRWTVTDDDGKEVVHHAGRTEGFFDPVSGLSMVSVDAPYSTVRTSQRRLPFIVDANGIDFEWEQAEIVQEASEG